MVRPKRILMRIFDRTTLPKTVLFFCIFLHAAITLTYSITLHYEFKTSGLDSAVYEQLMRNFLDGRGFYSSINPPYISQPWLGFHFSPILYLIVPFYYAYPHVETLLAIGSICVALAAWPIYLTAKQLLKDTFQAFIMALLYLISPFVLNGTLWGFHEIDFAPLCLGWMLWAVLQKKPRLLVVLSFVLLSIKEHYGLSVAGFGLLWAWQWKQPKFGLGLAALGIAVLCLIFMIIIPHFNPMGAPNMMNASSSQDRFSWITNMEGIQAHGRIFLSAALWYGATLLLPFLLLPLASFAWLLPAASDMAANLLSKEDMMRSVFSYHSLALFPILIVATCHSIKTYFNGRLRFNSNDIMLPITVAIAGFAYAQLALPFSEGGNAWELGAPKFHYADNDLYALYSINAIIPKDATIAAQINVLPHLTIRENMIPYPLDHDDPKVQYIVLKLSFPFTNALSLMGLPYGGSSSFYFSRVEALLNDKKWGIVLSQDRWVVLKRGAASDPKAHEDSLLDFDKLKNEYHVVRENFYNPKPM